jgi:hypothetical protein
VAPQSPFPDFSIFSGANQQRLAFLLDFSTRKRIDIFYKNK